MNNPTIVSAIKSFLLASTHKDLAELYNQNLEVQVNVAQDNGTRINSEFKGRQWHGYSDGIQTWKPIRIPWNANTDPQFDLDREMNYDLSEHVDGIGLTGWDWANKQSLWVGFDFDAMVGHSEKHNKKLTQEELSDIEYKVENIDWVTVRRSTSGKGLHIYVFIDPPIKTANHNEHAALAKAILSQLSLECNFDFSLKADTIGSILWVWHRKMKQSDGQGLKLIKRGNTLSEVPSNWKDYISVVSGRKQRSTPKPLSDDDTKEKLFDELTGQRTKVKLDKDHYRLLEHLKEKRFVNYWDSDRWMLVTHVVALKEAHQELGLKGFFDTSSPATEPQEQNCFCFPMRDGGWVVRRFTQGVAEHETWQQDGQGWSKCLGGETEILTKEGIFTIKELAKIGYANLYVLTQQGMKWINCEIKSFGIQKLYKVSTGSGDIRATIDHRWLYVSSHGELNIDIRKPTFILKKYDRLPLRFQPLPDVDWEGYAHGFVFGDGWFNKERDYCQIELHKRDMSIFNILESYGKHYVREDKNGDLINCFSRLPFNWKDLPKNKSKEYIFGFILGLIDSDGCITDSKSIIISNINKEIIEEVRKLALYCGLRVYESRVSDNSKSSYYNPETSSKYIYILNINTHNLTKDHFLRERDKTKFIQAHGDISTYIKSVDLTEFKEEEVYCAIVPNYHNFTLANGIVTGNCYLNQDPDLYTACVAAGGSEHKSGGFNFNEAEQVRQAAKNLGINFDLPNKMYDRQAKIKQTSAGKIVIEIERDSKDSIDDLEGWNLETKWWHKVFPNKINSNNHESEIFNYDDFIRHVISEDNKDLGWFIRSETTNNNEWNSEPYPHVKVALCGHHGYSPKEANSILGSNIVKPYIIVNRPFEVEYPGNRVWNRYAAKLRFTPTQSDVLVFPTWQKILDHCGKSLDNHIKEDDWCKQNNILTGSDYLKIWIASVIQKPYSHLPYLFFHGPENSGKSTFHNMLDLLMTSGYVRIDNALKSDSNFNAELLGAVICVIEETDLRKDRIAAARIKDWVNSKYIPIHQKQKTPFLIPNTLHFIHCNNDMAAAPISGGATRMTFIHVPLPEKEVPENELLRSLTKEAPDFTAEILSLELPPEPGRLAIPIINTADKIELSKSNRTPVQEFIEEKCFYSPGKTILLAELYDAFYRSTEDESDRLYWTKRKFSLALQPYLNTYSKGRLSNNSSWHIANLSFDPEDQGYSFHYVTIGEFLTKVENATNQGTTENITRTEISLEKKEG